MGKMSGLAAALALGAISHIDRLAEHRRQVARWYERELKDLVTMMPWLPDDASAYDVPWLVGVHVQSTHIRDALRSFLATNRIETRSYFLPLHLQPSYEVFLARSKVASSRSLPADPAPNVLQMPESERLSATGLNLPTHAYLTEADVGVIAQNVRRFFVQTLSPAAIPTPLLCTFFSFDETTRVTCRTDGCTQTDTPVADSPANSSKTFGIITLDGNRGSAGYVG